MENIIYQDSPLAEFLEGEGQAESEWVPALDNVVASSSDDDARDDFAPRGTSTLHSRLRDKLPQPLKIPLRTQGPVAMLHSACSRAVHSRLGRAENQHFIEHFRYLVVASQLLGDRFERASSRTPGPIFGAEFATPGSGEYNGTSSSVNGVLAVWGAAFITIWLVHYARSSRSSTRILTVAAVFSLMAAAAYLHLRRQRLLHQKQQAVDMASKLVTNLQAFEASSSSALTFVQEVELISRGYRLSSPLPPISRMEEKGQTRRCAKLRRTARGAYAALIPSLLEQCENLRKFIQEEDLDKYLDIYDIASLDLQEASLGYSDAEFDDADGLKALRVHQFRQGILRRVFLCCLLALEATGGQQDFLQWQAVIRSMEIIASVTGTWSSNINEILNEEEQLQPQSPHPKTLSPDRENIRTQLRQIGSLSQGIRGIQAKMQILREESNRSLEQSEDVSGLGPALTSQYESIGTDLRALMKAWEEGKSSLAANIDRAERRTSLNSNGLRSPALSLGGLTVVDEGSPSDALRALNGEMPTLSSSSNNSDEEIFEAIAIPRQRPRMTPEQRKVKIIEDRAKRQSLLDQRDATTSMLRELESVIKLRPAKPPGTRITTI